MSRAASVIHDYYKLAKPGIIRGNVMTAIGGYFFASRGGFDWSVLAAVIIGVSLVIGAACAYNNVMDRHIDSLMSRTKSRAMASGRISRTSANIYATVLGILGTLVLIKFTNPVTVYLGLIGVFFYVIVYGYFKRRTIYGTEVGSISGSTSIVAGYTAVTGVFDDGALILFLIMVFWQMPHFYAIAVMSIKDYKAANIPVLPIVKGIKETKKRTYAYMILFIAAIVSLTLADYAGYTYLIVMSAVGFYWLYQAVINRNLPDKRWALKTFRFSLIVLSILSVLISIDVWLP